MFTKEEDVGKGEDIPTGVQRVETCKEETESKKKCDGAQNQEDELHHRASKGRDLHVPTEVGRSRDGITHYFRKRRRDA